MCMYSEIDWIAATLVRLTRGERTLARVYSTGGGYVRNSRRMDHVSSLRTALCGKSYGLIRNERNAVGGRLRRRWQTVWRMLTAQFAAAAATTTTDCDGYYREDITRVSERTRDGRLSSRPPRCARRPLDEIPCWRHRPPDWTLVAASTPRRATRVIFRRHRGARSRARRILHICIIVVYDVSESTQLFRLPSRSLYKNAYVHIFSFFFYFYTLIRSHPIDNNNLLFGIYKYIHI